MFKQKKESEEELIKEAMSLLGKRSAGKKKNIDPIIAKERSQKAVEAKRLKRENKQQREALNLTKSDW
jgi:hypothetical protein